jgi:hypothetical protein
MKTTAGTAVNIMRNTGNSTPFASIRAHRMLENVPAEQAAAIAVGISVERRMEAR